MDKLGIQLPMLLTQIVNFSIMLFLLSKFLYKPILKALKQRKLKIAEGLAYTEKMQLQDEKLAKKHEEILQKARQEAKGIIEQAKKDANVVKQEILADGKKENEEMKAKIEADMKARENEMSEEMSRSTVKIAADMAKKLIADVLTDEQQHQLIAANLRVLEKSHEKKSGQ
jgi:F-type H+-transporting ATPase subunit b